MSDLIPFILCTSYSLKHYHASLFRFLLFSAESILNLYYGGDNFSFVTFTSLHTCSRQSVMLSNSLRVIFNPFTTTHFKTVPRTPVILGYCQKSEHLFFEAKIGIEGLVFLQNNFIVV